MNHNAPPEAMLQEYEQAIAVAWSTARNSLGIYISKWNPRMTHNIDMQRRRRASEIVRDWAIRWWEKRGYTPEITLDGEDIVAEFFR